jgi:2,3-bisphosphoglycerate-independent phosphoglycerate mutase
VRKVILVIRDGWGISADTRYNAVAGAQTPNVDRLLQTCPHGVLDASGEAVGLPAGYQGSSEVGHLNMGAGRIVLQELKRINDAIADGSLLETACFKRAIAAATTGGGALHVMGLVQDQGVHAHQDHLVAIMKQAAAAGVKKLYVHFFGDGRDTPPRSALRYVKDVRDKIAEYGLGEIGTVMGRYYSMDRARYWNLTREAYDAINFCKGAHAASAEEAFTGAYRDLKTPDGTDMTDEYIPPTIIGDYPGVKEGDAVIHFNYRQDRAIQLTKMFVEDECPGRDGPPRDLVYCGLTRYYDEFKGNLLEPLDDLLTNVLGKVLQDAGLRQLRIAETQKFRHVTSFFNGKLIEPFKGEDRIEIKSQFDPATFAEHPEMNAYDVAAEVCRQIEKNGYDFTVVNFANCDMVGHTGNYEAAVKAVHIVDECVGRVAACAAGRGCVVMVTSDHGNAEEMWDFERNSPKTAHTINPVQFIYLDESGPPRKVRSRGILSDIAPTILDVMGLPPPPEMTCRSLLAEA